jgi:hypothetical protein
MVEVTEKKTEDERGYVARYFADNVEFAHSVFTHSGYARGGSGVPYAKDVTICFGKIICVGLPLKYAREYDKGTTFVIGRNNPNLIVALEDNFVFVNHGGVGESVRNPTLKELKDKINSKEKDIETLLKEFGIIRSR